MVEAGKLGRTATPRFAGASKSASAAKGGATGDTRRTWPLSLDAFDRPQIGGDARDDSSARVPRAHLLLFALAASSGCARSSQPPSSADSAATKEEPAMRLADAADVLATVAGDGNDHRIPAAVAARARCVAVVPALVQGALFVGAKHGRGVLTCRTEGGWSSPAFFDVTGGTAGLEIGVQSVDLVMLVLTEHGRRAFASGDLRLGGDVSASRRPRGARSGGGYGRFAPFGDPQLLAQSRAVCWSRPLRRGGPRRSGRHARLLWPRRAHHGTAREPGADSVRRRRVPLAGAGRVLTGRGRGCVVRHVGAK